MVFQLVVATYGGFFGAGIGILMLAALGMMGVRDIHRANGLKNLAAVCINGVAAVTFVVGGRVAWAEAAVMAAGAMLGGALGAGTARKVGPRVVRRAVMTVGAADLRGALRGGYSVCVAPSSSHGISAVKRASPVRSASQAPSTPPAALGSAIASTSERDPASTSR